MTTVKTDLRPPFSITVNPDESRAVLISKSLRAVARRARTPRNIIGSISTPERRWDHVLAWAIILGFFIFVFVPTSVAAIYLGFFVSDQYATETRFALRGGEPHILNQFGGLVAMPAAQRAQDSMILIDYIRGRGMVDALNKTLNLRQLFARDNIDFFSRFNPKESDEELLYYWRRHVDVHVDSFSGIITMVVRAFTPQDSLNITKNVMQESERLVNDLSERASVDSLRRAELELTRAKQNLQTKVATLRDLRNAEGIIDTSKTGNVMVRMMGDLRLELIKLEQEYSAQRRTISQDAPQLKVLQARIDSMKDQILRVEGQMTGPVSPDKLTLANAMSRFDVAQIEKDVVEKQYVAAAAAYEQARFEVDQKNVYLGSFLTPVQAQEALYPRRMWLLSIVLFVGLLLWGGSSGIAILVRNYIAI